MKVLFLHGWHSTPGGVKPSHLTRHGHEVINPALDDDDWPSAPPRRSSTGIAPTWSSAPPAAGPWR